MQHIYSRLTRWVWVLFLAGQLTSVLAQSQTQAPGIQWQKIIEGPIGYITATNASDGGYVVASGDWKIIPTITKISADGQTTYWTTTLSLPDSLQGYKVDNYWGSSIITTSNGDYAVAGQYSANSGSGSYSNTYIVRISKTGQITKLADFTANLFMLTSFIESSDGGFLLSGWDYFTEVYPRVYKFDANGKLEWEINEFTLPQAASPRRYISSVTLSPENDYILAGTGQGSGGTFWGWMGKLSKDGKTYETNDGKRGSNVIYSIRMAQDKSGYITTMGGSTYHYEVLSTPVIEKLSLTGDSLWAIPNPDYLNRVLSLKNGNYLVSGSTQYKVTDPTIFPDIKLLNIKEGGTINWQRTLGGSQYDELSTAIATPDGGYLLAGITYSQDGDFSSRASSPAGVPAGWLIKIAPEAINEPIAQEQAPPMQWNKALPPANSYYGRSLIAKRADGGFFVANGPYNGTPIIVRLDKDGNTISSTSLPDNYRIIDFQATTDNNFVVTGTVSENKIFVRKIDQQGNTVFEKLVDFMNEAYTKYNTIEHVFPLTDGGFIVTGYYNVGSLSNGTYYQFDKNGNTIPAQIILNGSGIVPQYITEAIDGGLIEATNSAIVKHTLNKERILLYRGLDANVQIIKPTAAKDGYIAITRPTYQVFEEESVKVFKITADGILVWTRPIKINRDYPVDLLTEPDGSFVVVNTSVASDNNNDYLLRKFNSEGVLLWQQQIGGSKSDIPQRVVKANDGGYVVSGISQSSDLPGQSLPADGLTRPWVVKFGTAAPAALSLTTSYNCTTGQLTVQTQGGNSAPVEFQIAGLRGWSTDNTFTVPSYQRVGTTFTIQARQSGSQQSLAFTSACTTPTPPPTPAPGQFGLVAPAYDCASGKLTANYVNSNQVAAEFRIVGLRDWAPSPEFTVPSYQLIGTTLTIEARLASGQTASYPFTTTCVSSPPISETSGLFTISPVYDCNTGLLTLTPINSNGTPVEYQIAGLRGWSTNNAFGIPAYQRIGTSFTIQARQTGNTAAIIFTSACPTAPPSTTTSTPPSSTTTSPPSNTTSTPPSNTTVALSILEPTVICNDPKLGNQLTIQTKGGNGSAIEYRVIGLHDWSANNVFPFPYYQSRNTSFTLCARQSGTEVLRVYVTNCPHPAREAVPDPDGWQATVMPNPVSERFTVEVMGASGQAVHFQLTDMAGRALTERQTNVTTDQHQEPFTVPKQATGLYLLRVTTQHQRRTLKIMKY